MTNPKPAEARPAVTRTKSAKDGSASPDPVPRDENPMLDQLVALTRSIGELVQRNTGSGDVRTTTTDTDADRDAAERVVFAYDFLGVVLGRRAPSLFQLKTVTVTRDFGTLTFTKLAGATAAKIRSARNVVKTLEGLREGMPVTIDQDPDAITDDQRIDSIVTFTVKGGTPVAIGPCLGPAGGIIP